MDDDVVGPCFEFLLGGGHHGRRADPDCVHRSLNHDSEKLFHWIFGVKVHSFEFAGAIDCQKGWRRDVHRRDVSSEAQNIDALAGSWFTVVFVVFVVFVMFVVFAGAEVSSVTMSNRASG